jgi:hypothetical protein
MFIANSTQYLPIPRCSHTVIGKIDKLMIPRPTTLIPHQRIILNLWSCWWRRPHAATCTLNRDVVNDQTACELNLGKAEQAVLAHWPPRQQSRR